MGVAVFTAIPCAITSPIEGLAGTQRFELEDLCGSRT
jgi:hypothetical protein